MDDRDGLRERGRSLEEEWAQREARAAIEALRVESERAGLQRGLSQRTGIEAPDLLRRMVDLGFDAESIELLFLVPLVAMAGADGSVTYAERALVKEFARQGGICPGTRAWATLDGWLIESPPRELLEQMRVLFRDVVAALPTAQASELRTRLKAALERVARASGGFLGVGAVSRAERKCFTELEVR